MPISIKRIPCELRVTAIETKVSALYAARNLIDRFHAVIRTKAIADLARSHAARGAGAFLCDRARSAGAAGIRVSGSLNIAALVVTNSVNVQVVGVSSLTEVQKQQLTQSELRKFDER